jgi:hypothetical protein
MNIYKKYKGFTVIEFLIIAVLVSIVFLFIGISWKIKLIVVAIILLAIFIGTISG